MVPVWQSSQPTYSYRGRAQEVMDYLKWEGPQAVYELCKALDLEQMSLSSLMSQLCNQGWIRKLPVKKAVNDRLCLRFELTPRGHQVIENSPRSQTGR